MAVEGVEAGAIGGGSPASIRCNAIGSRASSAPSTSNPRVSARAATVFRGRRSAAGSRSVSASRAARRSGETRSGSAREGSYFAGDTPGALPPCAVRGKGTLGALPVYAPSVTAPSSLTLRRLPPRSGLVPSDASRLAFVEPLGGARLVAWQALVDGRGPDGLIPGASIPPDAVGPLGAAPLGRRVLSRVMSADLWELFAVEGEGAAVVVRTPTGEELAVTRDASAAPVVERTDAIAAATSSELAALRFVLAAESLDGSLWWASVAPDAAAPDAAVALRPPSLRTLAVSPLATLGHGGAVYVLVKASETRWRLVNW